MPLLLESQDPGMMLLGSNLHHEISLTSDDGWRYCKFIFFAKLLTDLHHAFLTNFLMPARIAHLSRI